MKIEFIKRHAAAIKIALLLTVASGVVAFALIKNDRTQSNGNGLPSLVDKKTMSMSEAMEKHGMYKDETAETRAAAYSRVSNCHASDNALNC